VRPLALVGILSLAVLSLGPRPAAAYLLVLEPRTPPTLAWGAQVTFDVYLDTQGQSGIEYISASFTYDSSVLLYRPDLSDAEDYYPLYAPGSGKSPVPSWLVPVADPPAVWTGTPPPIGGQVNVEFTEFSGQGTEATATHLWLATLTFQDVVGACEDDACGYVSNGEWGFGHEGNAFIVNGVDVAGTEAFAVGSAWIGVIPEPNTALLVGLGLAGLGWAARRPGRDHRC